jgi:hypothetical protein
MSTPEYMRVPIKRILDHLERNGVSVTSNIPVIRLISRFIPSFYKKEGRIFITKTIGRHSLYVIIVNPDYSFLRKGEYSFEILPGLIEKEFKVSFEGKKFKKICLFCGNEFFTDNRGTSFCSDTCSKEFEILKSVIIKKQDKASIPSLKMMYKVYKNNADSRGYVFELSFETFSDLVEKNCYYCGTKPKKYNGIDRKNNSVGYTKRNCIPCCFRCNRMKYTMSEEEFAYSIDSLKDWSEKYIKNHGRESLSKFKNGYLDDFW